MFRTLSYYFSIFHKDFVNYTSQKLQTLGLNYGSLFFLIYVGKNPDCTPSELTKALHVDWGHSQRSISKLEESGFLTKEKSGRSYHLTLTSKGLEAFQLSHQVFFDWDKENLQCLTDEEYKELLKLLQKVVDQKGCEQNV
ncbi:MAG: winged helix DNA-binding protein [Eubacteriales bacterium]|nr:winged helix DNA-binding protein [Eubacteriales bacterium]